MVERSGTDWIQDHIDTGISRAETLDRDSESWRDVFEQEVMDEHIADFEGELIAQLPKGALLRLAILASHEDITDYLDPRYSENQGATDGADLRRVLPLVMDEWVEFLKDKWKEKQA